MYQPSVEKYSFIFEQFAFQGLLYLRKFFSRKTHSGKTHLGKTRSGKTHTPYASISVVITLVVPAKVSIMKLKCSVLNRMWQHDFMMRQIFLGSIFLSENTGRLAKQAGYLGHDS
jgi:hypothetical protein